MQLYLCNTFRFSWCVTGCKMSAGCLFPLFYRLYFVPCPGARVLFEICIRSTSFSVKHAALSVQPGNCCQKSMILHGRDTWYVKMCQGMDKHAKSTLHLSSHTPGCQNTNTPYWKQYKTMERVFVLQILYISTCLWIYHHRPEWN